MTAASKNRTENDLSPIFSENTKDFPKMGRHAIALYYKMSEI